MIYSVVIWVKNELNYKKSPESGRELEKQEEVPDLESLNTDKTCRRKFVSCSALFEF